MSPEQAPGGMAARPTTIDAWIEELLCVYGGMRVLGSHTVMLSRVLAVVSFLRDVQTHLAQDGCVLIRRADV